MNIGTARPTRYPWGNETTVFAFSDGALKVRHGGIANDGMLPSPRN
jgi:hypothetical protein